MNHGRDPKKRVNALQRANLLQPIYLDAEMILRTLLSGTRHEIAHHIPSGDRTASIRCFSTCAAEGLPVYIASNT
jgi:hypothetical protein